MRPWLFLYLLCPASLPALFTVKGRIAIPLPAPACRQWWRERMLGNLSHFHQPWVKLRPGCYRQPQPVRRISVPFMSILSCRGPPVLPILSQCPQVHFKNTRCSGFSCCLLWLCTQARAGSGAVHQGATKQTPTSSLGRLHGCTEHAGSHQHTRGRQ